MLTDLVGMAIATMPSLSTSGLAESEYGCIFFFFISRDIAKLLGASLITGLSWLGVLPEAEVECLGTASSD